MGELPGIDALLAQARTATGLDAFGADPWREGLERLLDAAAREAELNALGRMILGDWIGERLRNRLKVVDWLAGHPEVARARIVRPIVVLGMLRTGTTLLLELLARDPANRPLMKWEALDCVPPPERATFHTDPRIAPMIEKMDRTYAAVPALKAVHFEPGDGPTECVALLGQSFRSQDWGGLFHVPSYTRWFMHCDMTAAYAYHRSCLRLLQTRASGRWVLKAPGHMLALDALLSMYPDACIVVTHRDPLKTVASSASLSVTAKPGTLTRRDLTGFFGREWLDILGTMVDKMLDFRDRNPGVPMYDLHYRDLVRDPVGAIADIYRHFGDELSPTARAAMDAHLAAHPRERHGAHRYALADFGLSPDNVRDRFRRYQRRFDIAEES
jgi:hypothetical protein